MAELPPLPALCRRVREPPLPACPVPSAPAAGRDCAHPALGPAGGSVPSLKRALVTTTAWVCAPGAGQGCCGRLRLLTSSPAGSQRSKAEWAGVQASKSVLLLPLYAGSGALSGSVRLGVGTGVTEAAGALPLHSACLTVMRLLVQLAPFGCVRTGALVPSPLVPLQQQTVADH